MVLLRFYEWPSKGYIEFNIQNKVSSENSSYPGEWVTAKGQMNLIWTHTVYLTYYNQFCMQTIINIEKSMLAWQPLTWSCKID